MLSLAEHLLSVPSGISSCPTSTLSSVCWSMYSVWQWGVWSICHLAGPWQRRLSRVMGITLTLTHCGNLIWITVETSSAVFLPFPVTTTLNPVYSPHSSLFSSFSIALMTLHYNEDKMQTLPHGISNLIPACSLTSTSYLVKLLPCSLFYLYIYLFFFFFK